MVNGAVCFENKGFSGFCLVEAGVRAVGKGEECGACECGDFHAFWKEEGFM